MSIHMSCDVVPVEWVIAEIGLPNTFTSIQSEIIEPPILPSP